MAIDSDQYQTLQAEYRAAAAQERAEWKTLNDTALSPVERVKAYARWANAAERVKALSISMRGSAAPVQSPPG